MSSFLAGVLTFLASTNAPDHAARLVSEAAGVEITLPNPNDPVEKEFQKLLRLDDDAQAEADRWIQENASFQEQGAGVRQAALALRIEQRFESVRKAYDAFLQAHPRHTRAWIAYGSFLSDTGDEEAAEKKWTRALELEPNNPAAINNMANLYGHTGRARQAFQLYEKAIALKPREPVYIQNLATSVFMFRKDAMEHYQISEQEVFTKALGLYRQALEADPKNFIIATELAQCFYIIQPPRLEEARQAWTHAQSLARDDIERQGVSIHLARIEIQARNFDAARTHLEAVQHSMYREMKARVAKNLASKEAAAKETSAPKPD